MLGKSPPPVKIGPELAIEPDVVMVLRDNLFYELRGHGDTFGGTDRNPGIIESSLPVGRLRSRSHPIAWLLRSVLPCDRTPPWKTPVATPPYLQRGRRAIHHRRGPLVAGPVALWVSVQFLRAAAAATLLVEWQPNTTATTSDNPVSPST